MKFIDVFKSDKQRSCDGGQESVSCTNIINEGDLYVLISIGNGKASVCEKCFKDITNRFKNKIIWDNKAKKYKKY